MKKVLLLFVLIPLFSFNSSKTEKDLTGKWKGEDEKNKITYMTFDNEGYVTIEAEGETFGGKEFEIKGEKGSMSYTINSNVKPIQIDLIVTKLETKEQQSILLIAEFKDHNTMIMASNFNSVRPTEFNTENSITFKRVKQK